MNEYVKSKLRLVGSLLLFIIFAAMVVVGQAQVGYARLGIMLLGLAGILALLYFYNKRYR